MVADVPVGAFLSGGIDSTLVVALMQQHSRQPVHTFTVGFADRAFDESAEAAAVAAHLGTDHTTMDITDDEAARLIPDLPDIWDEPFGDVSAIPMHLVSRLARSRVTVALSGDGGDELFAGYNRHAWLERLWRRASLLPAPVRRTAATALGHVPPSVVDTAARATSVLPARMQVRNPSSKVAKVAKVLGASGTEDAYLSLVSYWDDAESMVRGAGANRSVASRPSEWPELGGITEQMLWLDLVGYLPDDILTKLDRAAMACSLETRVPFLDRDVFDLAWRLPLEAKLHEGTTKWLVRQVLYRHIPEQLVERPEDGVRLPHRRDAARTPAAMGGRPARPVAAGRPGPVGPRAHPAGLGGPPRRSPRSGPRAVGCAGPPGLDRPVDAGPGTMTTGGGADAALAAGRTLEVRARR